MLWKTGKEGEVFPCWLRYRWGFGPCGYGTFLRKEIDLEDILMQAAVWTILPGFLLPQKASARAAVGVQKLSGPLAPRSAPPSPPCSAPPRFHLIHQRSSCFHSTAVTLRAGQPSHPGGRSASHTHNALPLERRTCDGAQEALVSRDRPQYP